MDSVDVLVVGAGPTGLTLGCELARAGVSVFVVEASVAPQQGSRGKGLQPRSLEAFDDLGIVDHILAEGRTGLPVTSVDAQGRETTRAEVIGPSPAIPYPSTLIIPQWRVETTLRERLRELGGRLSFGCELASYRELDDHIVAELIHDGAPIEIEARWLVGCDGGHSLVRRHAGIPFVGATDDTVRMIVADVRVTGIDRDAWRQWRHAEGFFALCPLPSSDEFQLQASITADQDPALTLVNLQKLLDRRIGSRSIRLSEPTWASLWRANARLAERYRVGRVLVAGDAAHVHSPAGGQGMNTGIQDARNLGWKLVAVLKGARPALIDTYEEERLPVAASALALSEDLLRQAIAARGIVTAPREQTNQLEITYRGSSLSRDDCSESASLRAGDRAPDATGLVGLEGEVRLFDLLRGAYATCLLFGNGRTRFELPRAAPARSVRVVRIVERPTGPDEFADMQGHLAEAYAPVDDTTVLIRPDGHIGLISHRAGPEDAVRYYRNVLSHDD